MLSEACATGKPVFMFDLGGMRAGYRPPRDFRWTGLLYRLLMRVFWRKLSRDITLVHSQLTASGRAAWLGDAPPLSTKTELSDMEKAVAGVKRLFPELAGALDG